MANWFTDNSASIGRTPLVRLNRIGRELPVTIFAKIESRNPAYSVKCRVGAAMVWAAERQGLLKPGVTLIEATSGNSGIALAAVAAARGIPITLTMPDTMSRERRVLLGAYGAKLLLTDGRLGMRGAVEAAERLAAADPDRYLLLEQFKNPANPAIHEQTTGPEIWQDSAGTVDVFVAGVGTGGTITGTGRFLKRQGKRIETVAVEPAASPVLSQTRAGQVLQPGAHGIQGIGAGFVPAILDLDLIDRIETASETEAVEYARRLAKEEGILAGLSSGAALAATMRLAALPDYAGLSFVVMLPDSGERYLSSALFGA
ncbi:MULTISPECIES: cysteine synthase A [Methylomonas]|uniref:Cysteine synthase n=1 Tax=Methylomonas koyamae TaxID=702114 RepID=A0A177NI97_9GAMM|nr:MULTISPECIES: cysteine synthase A [Methylomonas]OAI16780.1 cysteine synthase A [Methylomonas koyamae]OHX36336.1 cysteine synthase A [Methylomonas sp. LWB]